MQSATIFKKGGIMHRIVLLGLLFLSCACVQNRTSPDPYEHAGYRNMYSNQPLVLSATPSDPLKEVQSMFNSLSRLYSPGYYYQQAPQQYPQQPPRYYTQPTR